MKKNIGKIIFKYLVLAIAIAINVFIMVNAYIEGGESGKISTSVGEAVISGINSMAGEEIITQAAKPSFLAFFRKFAGHFALFGTSGFFTTLSYYLFLDNTKLGKVWLESLFSIVTGVVFAVWSELAQIHVDGRNGNFKDILIDSSGYLLGFIPILVVIIIIKICNKNRKEKQA